MKSMIFKSKKPRFKNIDVNETKGSKNAAMRMSALTFCLLLFSMFSFGQNWDIELLRHINVDRIRSLDQFFIVITNNAAPIAYSLPFLLLFYSLYRKNRPLKIKSLYIIGSSMLSLLMSTSIKHLVDRPRPFITYPFIEKLTYAGSPSFPSGHTSDAFTLAISLSLVFRKWWVIWPSFLWAAAVGYSRMHLGVHYPTDVIGSIALAAISSIACFILLRRREKRELLSKNF